MKKSFILFSILAVAALFVGCNNSEEFVTPQNPKQDLTKPQTEVYFQGQALFPEGVEAPAVKSFSELMTRASDQELAWPLHTNDGWESARFSIRADGTIPDFYDKSSALYYGRSAGKPGHNRGKVSSIYKYSHYNDRDFDYYQRDKSTGENIGLFRYIYDPDGVKTQPVILEAPTVEEILSDEVADLEANIANGKNVEKNTAELAKVNAILANTPEYLQSHVLWYVVKEVGMQYGWHVNGIISDTEVPPFVPGQVADDVEVDIHQQDHTDWYEIKTSIHIRTDVESIKVTIPLKQEDILEKDDFDIRVYDYYYKEYVIKHNITHDANGITIEITDIPASLIDELKANYGDGLTVEVHSYCTKDVWEEMKSSSVQTGKPCNVYGQVSSALRPGEEEKKIYAEKSN